MRRLVRSNWTLSFSDLLVLGLLFLLILESGSPPIRAATVPTLDSPTGSAAAVATTSPISVTITTSNTNDLVLAVVAGPSGTTIGTPTGSPTALTFTNRCTVDGGTNQGKIEEFYAVSTGTLSSETISATFSTEATLVVFAVSNDDIAHPFDPGLSSCIGSTGSGSSASVTLLTTGTGDMIIGSISVSGTSPGYTVGSTFTDIKSALCPSCTPVAAVVDAEYKTSTVAASQAVTYGISGTGLIWSFLADALVSASGIPELPYGLIPFVLAVPIIYYLIRTQTRPRVPGAR